MKKLVFFSTALSALASQVALAGVALEPASIDMEPFKFIPSLTVSALQDSNIYSSSTNEVSSSVVQVAPRFDLVARDRNNSYTAKYAILAGLYGESNNNYIDHKFDLGTHIEPTDRFRFDVGASFGLLHDDLGTAATDGVASAVLALRDPDEYKQKGVTGGLEYGAKEASGQLVLNTGYTAKSYDDAAVAVSRDMATLNNLLGFRLRMAPKTKAILDLEYNKGSYDNAVTANISDYTETNYMLGVSWEKTAATTGKARIGRSKRETNVASNSKAIWDLGVQWTPQDRDRFSLNVGKRFQDGNNATTIDSTNYTASWTHDWMDRLQSVVNVGLLKEDYQGIARNDETKNLGASLNYQMRRWFVLGGGVTLKDRSSTLPTAEHDRMIVSLNAQLSL